MFRRKMPGQTPDTQDTDSQNAGGQDSPLAKLMATAEPGTVVEPTLSSPRYQPPPGIAPRLIVPTPPQTQPVAMPRRDLGPAWEPPTVGSPIPTPASPAQAATPAAPAPTPSAPVSESQSRPMTITQHPAQGMNAPSMNAQAPQSGHEGRKLIVGRDIALSGEIASCDHLVVEGTVEAKLHDARYMEIAAGGAFRGTVEIETADIAGRFEGDLTVRGRLCIRASGKVQGKIRCGELQVDLGGQLMGEISALTPAEAAKAGARPQQKIVNG